MITDVDVEYYDLKGSELHIKLPPGDLQLICNVLHDYADLLLTLANSSEEGENFRTAFYEVHANRCKKVQGKIEEGIGYSTEKAIEKCEKKKKRKSDDIGEDAMVLAVKKRNENTKKQESETKERNKRAGKASERVKKEEKSAKDDAQISIFDLMQA